jgi:queuine tRNA-ribosyltransferase
MAIQRRLGADIVMVLDECCAIDLPRRAIEQSVERTARWARRCRQAALAPHQFLFGIVQGGLHQDLRRRSAAQVRELDFDGYAIGGVSVGEGHALMVEVVQWTARELPEDRPRYLMGVGLPEDLLEAVERGMDMFDCVIPTRYARGGSLFTRRGRLRIGDKRYRHDDSPIDPRCECYACQHYSRMVLRHLHYAHEPVFETLASLHNLRFYQDLMADCRHEIERGRFGAWKAAWLKRYRAAGGGGSEGEAGADASPPAPGRAGEGD